MVSGSWKIPRKFTATIFKLKLFISVSEIPILFLNAIKIVFAVFHCINFVFRLPGDIEEAEKQWKLQFHEWSTKYIVDWKHQYDYFLKNQHKRCRSSDNYSEDDWNDNT